MMDRLLKRRADAEATVEEMDAAIADAIAHGRPDDEVQALRERRRDAVEDADDTGEALRVVEDRERVEATREARKRRAELVREARERAEALIESARAVDGALAALETAAAAHQLAALDAARALRRAGLSDDGRIGRMIRPFAKWSSWHGAPTWAEMAEMARTPFAKRRALEGLVRNVIPSIPEETDR